MRLRYGVDADGHVHGFPDKRCRDAWVEGDAHRKAIGSTAPEVRRRQREASEVGHWMREYLGDNFHPRHVEQPIETDADLVRYLFRSRALYAPGDPGGGLYKIAGGGKGIGAITARYLIRRFPQHTSIILEIVLGVPIDNVAPDPRPTAELVRALRGDKTQSELAAQMQIRRTTISLLENGHVGLGRKSASELARMFPEYRNEIAAAWLKEGSH